MSTKSTGDGGSEWERNDRQDELSECLRRNLENPFIDKVYILLEYELDFWKTFGSDFEEKYFEKVVLYNLNKRLTYKDAFDYANATFESGDVCLLINNDIYFDESIEVLRETNLENSVFCLTRYDVHTQEKIVPHGMYMEPTENPWSPPKSPFMASQDAWIFETPIREIKSVDFPLGYGWCDMYIATTLHEGGYKVSNPCYRIVAKHIDSVTATGSRQRDNPLSDMDKKCALLEPTDVMFPHDYYQKPLGMQSGDIISHQLTSSSKNLSLGRLHTEMDSKIIEDFLLDTGKFLSEYNYTKIQNLLKKTIVDVDDIWYEVDFNEQVELSCMKQQGYGSLDEYAYFRVISYKMSYMDGEGSWKYVENQQGTDRIFKGPPDAYNSVSSVNLSGLSCSKLRIHPIDWKEFPFIRVEFYTKTTSQQYYYNATQVTYDNHFGGESVNLLKISRMS